MNVTLAEAIETFLAQYKPTTRETYRQSLDMLQTYIAPGIPIQQITPFDVLRAVNAYESRDTVSSVHTVNKFIKTVKRFFNWCVKTAQLLTESPATVEYRQLPADQDPKAMPEQTYQHLVDYWRNLADFTRQFEPHNHPRTLRAYALILFLDTGARRGGCHNLKWHHIDFRVGEAVVTEKGDKPRVVFLSRDVCRVLQEWRIAQTNGGNYVFSEDGHSITAASLGQYFRRACKAAGIGSWGMHSVRHRKGWQLESIETPDHIAAQILGHSVETYQKYYVRKDLSEARKTAHRAGISLDSGGKSCDTTRNLNTVAERSGR